MNAIAKAIVISSVVALSLQACQTPPPITSGIGAESLTNEIPPATYLKVDNPELAELLTISDVKNRLNNGLLEVNTELSSQYEKSLKLQYQFQWFDPEGFAVEAGKRPWQPLELHGFQSISLQAVAPNSRAKSFKVYIRPMSSNAYKF
ncbi:YcfL family protein [Thalassotalea marina]|uniref:DUF1425 domain-containing protein n=1 Tax=Thalassotalea marina TaxID=1673741 RepID=A0A919BPF4_9GAMM|nr:YcfL family protein [Thalassotalea marina]GHG02287.1 hypothetical protein GCM10017161_33980 [Thalassotalea marina]